jgi:Zn-dependent peptidase ImmA (M78 family)
VNETGRHPLPDSGRVEWEANWFAAALLMPQKDVKRLRSQGAGIASLASHFGVSVAAMSIRCDTLGV